MPMFTYTPDWEAVSGWYAKVKKLVPADWDGLVGIRLHRTGQPLSLEFFGAELPDEPLYPMILLEIQGGELARDWDKIEDDYDVPWVKFEDFKRFGDNVMEFFHVEDHYEAAAEEIALSDSPDDDLLRKVVIDRQGVLA